jgi:hypothetical protein
VGSAFRRPAQRGQQCAGTVGPALLLFLFRRPGLPRNQRGNPSTTNGVRNAVGAVLAVGMASITLVNVVAGASESHRIESYGERVEVEGGLMNVVVNGEGEGLANAKRT